MQSEFHEGPILARSPRSRTTMLERSKSNEKNYARSAGVVGNRSAAIVGAANTPGNCESLAHARRRRQAEQRQSSRRLRDSWTLRPRADPALQVRHGLVGRNREN